MKKIGEVAPRTHNLVILSENSDLELDEDTQKNLGILMKYQLQGRYPDYNPELPDQARLMEYYNRTKDLLQWLKMKL